MIQNVSKKSVYNKNVILEMPLAYTRDDLVERPVSVRDCYSLYQRTKEKLGYRWH